MVNNCEVYRSFPYKKYYSLMCRISQNPDTGNYIIVSQDEYCEKCSKQYANIYNKWCSCQNNWNGNKKIDDLIQEIQLKFDKFNNVVVEWIPYNQFINIIETAKDNNNTAIIYSAIWNDGPLEYDTNAQKYKRDPNKKVALKYSQILLKNF